jgi:membrane glycosyltransferase
MNNTTEYIDAMPLTDIEKAALPKSDIRAVQTALDGEHHQFTRDDDTPLGSVKARLEQAWPDSLAEGQLVKDDEGRDQLRRCRKQRVPLCSRTVAHQPGGPLLGSSARA